MRLRAVLGYWPVAALKTIGTSTTANAGSGPPTATAIKATAISASKRMPAGSGTSWRSTTTAITASIASTSGSRQFATGAINTCTGTSSATRAAWIAIPARWRADQPRTPGVEPSMTFRVSASRSIS